VQTRLRGTPFFPFQRTIRDVKELQSRSTLFWHARGFDEDENKHPDKTEYVGIVIAEAVFAGCVPFVVRKGGQPESVHHDIDGLWWDTLAALKECTLQLINEPEERDWQRSRRNESSI